MIYLLLVEEISGNGHFLCHGIISIIHDKNSVDKFIEIYLINFLIRESIILKIFFKMTLPNFLSSTK